MPDLKHGSGTDKVPYHHKRYENNMQALAQDCDETGIINEKNIGKLSETRIPLEHLDKSVLVMQCKAYEEYIGRLLRMINQPGEEDQLESELNFQKSLQEEYVEGKTEVTEAENPEKRKGAKRKCEKHSKAKNKAAEKRNNKRKIM